MNTQPLIRPLVAMIASGGVFLVASALQEAALVPIDVGVSAPYLPAGVRLVAVAVFGVFGCVGLFLGSLWLVPKMFPLATLPSIVAIAAVGAFVPLLTLAIVRRLFGIGEHLHELSFRLLLVLISMMSVLSPLAHQIVFLITGVAPASLYNLLAMIAGDVVGCMLVVLTIAAIWGWIERRSTP